MGSLFKSSTPAPAPPAPPVTVEDYVNGVEQVPVTNPDGSVTYVTRQLPLTVEQQAEKDQLDKIMQDSLAEIQKLSASDYAPDADTQNVLEQWQKQQEKLLGRQYTARSDKEEQSLAQRGLSDSTAAQAVRRQRALDQQDAEQNLDLQKQDLANQIRGEKLGLQQNLYNIAASQSNADAANVAKAATDSQSAAAALNAQRQASITDYYNDVNRSNGLFGNSLSSSLGGSIGRTLGGNILGGVGGLLGSLFGR